MPTYDAVGQPERRRRDLHYDDRTPPGRIAAPLAPQVGRFFGQLDDTLVKDGEATFSIYTWNGTDWEDTNKNLEVREISLSTGETFTAGDFGLAVRYINTWVFVPLSFDSDAQFVRFELFQQLVPHGSALAFVLNYNAATGGYTSAELVTVHDNWFTSANLDMPYADMFAGFVGSHGVGMLRNTDGAGLRHFDIAWMGRPARFIFVETLGDYNFTNNTIQCKLLEYWDQGYRPITDEQSPVTCHDPYGMFYRPDDESHGVAVYRADQNRYDLVWLEQVSTLYTATLGADMLGGDATIDTQSVQAMGWSLYFKREEPFPATITNPRNHFGRSGDEVVICIHDERSPFQKDIRYEILSVRQRPTWGFAKLNGTLPTLGSVTATVWRDNAGTMEITTENILIHDRMLDADLAANTRITWDYDPVEKRFYLRTHSCAADDSSSFWGSQ